MVNGGQLQSYLFYTSISEWKLLEGSGFTHLDDMQWN